MMVIHVEYSDFGSDIYRLRRLGLYHGLETHIMG